jgi:hypothetical protein
MTTKTIKSHQYEEGLQHSKRWLETKYEGLSKNKEWKNFGLDEIYISKSGRNCGFYSERTSLSHYMKGRRIKIGLRRCDTYYSYLRKNPLLSPIWGIPIDRYDGYRVCLTHELTHFIQYLEGRKYSEVETTKNEMEYILWICPYIECGLISYEERKRNEEEFKKHKQSDMWGVRR